MEVPFSDTPLRLYKAMMWATTPDSVGVRVSVFASNLDEALSLLEEKHGKGTIFNLHNEEDADKCR